MSWVLLSLKVPVAVNCWVEPAGMEAVDGPTAMETSVACVTISEVEPLTAPAADVDAAVMVAVPLPMVVASPVELMVAMVRSLELQVEELVTSCVVPSENVPVAVNCCVVPEARIGPAGVTVMETRTAVTVSEVEAVTEAEVA